MLLFFGLAVPTLLVTEFVFAAAGKALHIGPQDPVLAISSQAVAYVAIFLFLAVILRLGYDAPFWPSLGWRPSHVTSLTAITLGVLLAFAIALLGGLLHVESQGSEITKLLSTARGLITVSIFAVTVAPLAEELIFRGFLQPLLIRSLGVIAGILVTSALFGMLHFEEYGKSWGSAALIGTTGLALGVLRYVSGSTRISSLTHIAYNSTLFVAFFVQRSQHT